MSFASMNTAAEAVEAIKGLFNKFLEEVRPAYKQATVSSVDLGQRVAYVVYPDEGTPVPVALTSVIPRPGQLVTVDGRPGDRHVTEVVGVPVGTAGPIFLPATFDYRPGWTDDGDPLLDDYYDVGDGDTQPYVPHMQMPKFGTPRWNFVAHIEEVWRQWDLDILWFNGDGGSGAARFHCADIIELNAYANPYMSSTSTGADDYGIIDDAAENAWATADENGLGNIVRTRMIAGASRWGTRAFRVMRIGASSSGATDGDDTIDGDIWMIGVIIQESGIS